jgi:hypothetical protein
MLAASSSLRNPPKWGKTPKAELLVKEVTKLAACLAAAHQEQVPGPRHSGVALGLLRLPPARDGAGENRNTPRSGLPAD